MRISQLSLPLFLAAAAGCGSPGAEMVSSNGDGPPQTECTTPLETREPNVESSRSPAFAEQTRACEEATNVNATVTVLAEGLVNPWAVEPLPNGDFLVTERPGRLRIVSSTGALGAPISGLPEVVARGQGGLLDVALAPDFASSRTIFWSYAEPREGGNGTAVARGNLSEDGTSVQDVQVIFRVTPTYDGTHHFGSRLAFDSNGMLYITTGDRSDAPMRHHAQELDNHLGKVLRINQDGSIPSDNPFVDQEGAMDEIWSYGHRNIQAMNFDPEGQLWIVEHGTRGGDELNLIRPGVNYGWPRQAYGIEYSGAPIPGADTQVQGMEQPVYYWDPVIAPSGAQFYTGSAFPEWQGSMFIGAMADTRLVRISISNGRVTGEEHLFLDRGKRIRDVRQGTDGALYVVTDESDGELWRIAPGG